MLSCNLYCLSDSITIEARWYLTIFQLEHSLKQLSKIKTLIVGGGPISEKTKKILYKNKTDVYETFGMTETVSHVALKHVSQGEQEFKALKGVRFQAENNCLKVFCDSVLTNPILTTDVVDLISEKSFIWKGRADFVINSGAIKIYPEELEKKLNQTISVPFVILGFPDEKLGEKITIVFEGVMPLPADRCRRNSNWKHNSDLHFPCCQIVDCTCWREH